MRAGRGAVEGPAVRAAGGVVARPAARAAATRAGQSTEVVLVHRPKYDDWTLPKGKCEPGEDDLDCALREVAEETGVSCRAVTELASASYLDRQGRRKTVRYWLMAPEVEAWPPSAVLSGEVDEIEWHSVAGAAGRLTYERDREVLASAARALRGDGSDRVPTLTDP